MEAGQKICIDQQLLSEESDEDSRPPVAEVIQNENSSQDSVALKEAGSFVHEIVDGNSELPKESCNVLAERDSPSLSGNAPSIPKTGLFMQRTTVIENFIRVVISEEYFEDGRLVFSTTPVVQDQSMEPQETLIDVTCCSEAAFQSGKDRVKEKIRGSQKAKTDIALSSIKLDLLMSDSSARSSRSRVDMSKFKKTPTVKKGQAKAVEMVTSQQEDMVKVEPSKVYTAGIYSFFHGQAVFAMWDDGRWYAGRISAIRGSKFRIDWCENDQQNYLLGDKVIQAKQILQKGLPVSVLSSNKDHYDDVVLEEYRDEGKHRIRGKKGAIKTCNFDDMMVKPETVNKWKKSMHLSPNSPCGKRARSLSVKSDSITNTKSVKRSRKSVIKKAHEPSPEEDGQSECSPEKEKKPFDNCSFLVTSSNEQANVFDRSAISNQIVDNGGAVMDSFEELWKVGGKRFLIAPGASRTAKFLQCLAAGIPCISSKWILDTSKSGKWIEFDKYRLPAGKHYDSGELQEWKPRKVLLDHLRIALVGGAGFLGTWIPALKAAKAIPAGLQKKDQIGRFDVVVSETIPDLELHRNCDSHLVPLVSVEWIAQTVINGRKEPFDLFAYAEEDCTSK